MIDRRHSFLSLGSLAIAVLCMVAAAGCNKPDEQKAGGPTPGAPSGPPGGPRGRPGGPAGSAGGQMGGPGGRMGGPGGGFGGRNAPVAANATASEIFQQKCQMCHGSSGQGGRGGAPALTAVANRSKADLKKI